MYTLGYFIYDRHLLLVHWIFITNILLFSRSAWVFSISCFYFLLVKSPKMLIYPDGMSLTEWLAARRVGRPAHRFESRSGELLIIFYWRVGVAHAHRGLFRACTRSNAVSDRKWRFSLLKWEMMVAIVASDGRRRHG